ncbi:hypothetical protein FOCC_FOCC012229 [Frankliniella occidentalis]|nr:hypothetical protein FOCC_FOCC012229 [Frankliniella occidentalis]
MVADLLPGPKTTYLSYDKFMPDDTWEGVHVPVTQDILESTEAPTLPPHRLNIKVGSIVMLLCNVDVSRGLCNGSRFKVLVGAIQYQVLVTSWTKGTPQRAIFISKDDAGLPGVISRQQFQVRLAYCVTINKAQGSTYTRVGMDLPLSCFSHGQLYVALSREKKRTNVFIHIRRASKQGYVDKAKPSLWTRNEVYRKLLHTVNSHPNYTKLL